MPVTSSLDSAYAGRPLDLLADNLAHSYFAERGGRGPAASPPFAEKPRGDRGRPLVYLTRRLSFVDTCRRKKPSSDGQGVSSEVTLGSIWQL